MKTDEVILQLKDNRLLREEILAYFLKTQARVAELVEVSTTKSTYPLQEHASWILIHATLQKKSEIEKYQSKIIDHFIEISPRDGSDLGNQTVLRNICKVLTELPLIEHRDGELLDLLVSHLKKEENKVALHAYSLIKITQFVKKFPEIKTEIEEIIFLKKENGLAPSLRQVVRDFEKL